MSELDELQNEEYRTQAIWAACYVKSLDNYSPLESARMADKVLSQYRLIRLISNKGLFMSTDDDESDAAWIRHNQEIQLEIARLRDPPFDED